MPPCLKLTALLAAGFALADRFLDLAPGLFVTSCQVGPHACARHHTTRAPCSTPLPVEHAAVVVACWFAPQGDFGVRFSGLAGEVTPRVLAKGDLGAPGTVGSNPRCTEIIPKPIPALSHCCAPHPMRLMCTRTRPEIANVSGASSHAWWAQGGEGRFRVFECGLKIAHLTAQPPPCMFDTRAPPAQFLC